MSHRPQVQRVCFVVPTYNEAENVAAIVRQLLAIFDHHERVSAQVLVVDDESPDGTGEIVAALQNELQGIHLLQGAKQGLGAAYTRGIAYVLEHLEVDAVVQMDADFSHAPLDAIRLIDALDDADVAIGSRYVPGGSVDSRWGLRRKLLSKWGNRFARYVAGIYQVRDCTAGFKAIRVEALRRVFPLRLPVQGYVFQVASLHALYIDGARIVEVPIYFADREAGVTKLGKRDVAEFFLHVWWLRLLSRKTFIKFALTGLSGVVVNLGCFQALNMLGLNSYVASAIAIETSIIWNFFLNNFWTFRDRTIAARKRVRGLKFNVVSFFTLGISFGTFVLLRWAVPELPAVGAQFFSIFPAALANYFANSYWTFRADKV